MNTLTREQVSKAFIGLYHDGASVGQRKTFDILLAHDAALREELATMTALYEASKGTQAADYVTGLLQHRTQLTAQLAAVTKERDEARAKLMIACEALDQSQTALRIHEGKYD